MEICNRCNGNGYIEKGNGITFCDKCGGYGTNDWVGNATGNSAEKPIVELIMDICASVVWELNDKTTREIINNLLSELSENLNLKFKIMVTNINHGGNLDIHLEKITKEKV